MFALQTLRRVSLWAMQPGAPRTLQTQTCELSQADESVGGALQRLTIPLGCRKFAERVGLPFKTPEEVFG